MNAEKAREYFSSYFEGELQGGLKESFERSLNTNAQVQAEYRAFEQTMQGLGSLYADVPEPDFDLHERISQRIDKHFYELDRAPRSSFWSGWRRFAVAGIAGIAVVGAGISLMNSNNGNATSGVIPSGGGPKKPQKANAVDATRIELTETDGKWVFHYTPVGSETVEVRDESGMPIQDTNLTGEKLECPLVNEGSSATSVQISVSSASNPVFVALPGSDTSEPEASGKGKLIDLAKSAAQFFGRPIMVAVKNGNADVAWKFDSDHPVASITASIESLGYNVEELDSGALRIR